MIAAIITLFVLVVGCVFALVALVVLEMRALRANCELVQIQSDAWRNDFANLATALIGQFAADLNVTLTNAQAERTFLYRAVVARGAGELGHLQRIEHQGEQKAGAPGRQMSPAEYERWVEEDLQRMVNGERDSEISLVPEGF